MKTSSLLITLICLLIGTELFAQNGKILSKELLVIPDKVVHRIDSLDKNLRQDLRSVNLYRVVYLSDGLKVVGFVAEPKATGKYPSIIANRGGRWNFGLWKPFTIASYLGRMASWGYVVVASQYRGSSDGGDGKEEFGGRDVNDVLNLLPLIEQMPALNLWRDKSIRSRRYFQVTSLWQLQS